MWRTQFINEWRAGRRDFSGEEFQGVTLVGMDLSDADFSHCNFSYSCLNEAKFSNSNLTGASLETAHLEGTDFTGATLFDTCLDPTANPNMRVDSDFKTYAGNVIGYRTSTSLYMKQYIKKSSNAEENKYIPGHSYTAPVFSVSPTVCHPGIYLCPSIMEVVTSIRQAVDDRVVNPHETPSIVKCYSRVENGHKVRNKYRFSEIRVSCEVIKENGVNLVNLYP